MISNPCWTFVLLYSSEYAHLSKAATAKRQAMADSWRRTSKVLTITPEKSHCCGARTAFSVIAALIIHDRTAPWAFSSGSLWVMKMQLSDMRIGKSSRYHTRSENNLGSKETISHRQDKARLCTLTRIFGLIWASVPSFNRKRETTYRPRKSKGDCCRSYKLPKNFEGLLTQFLQLFSGPALPEPWIKRHSRTKVT